MKTPVRGLTMFLLGAAVGGGAAFAAFRCHVVRADDGWHAVTKSDPLPADCYADVRGWSPADWAAHPRLAATLVEAGYGDLVARTAAAATFDRLLERK